MMELCPQGDSRSCQLDSQIMLNKDIPVCFSVVNGLAAKVLEQRINSQFNGFAVLLERKQAAQSFVPKSLWKHGKGAVNSRRLCPLLWRVAHC